MGIPKGKVRFGQRYKVLKTYAKKQSARKHEKLVADLGYAHLGQKTSLKIMKKRYAIIARDALNALGVKSPKLRQQVHQVLSSLNAREAFQITQTPSWRLRLPIASRLEKILGQELAERFEEKFQEFWGIHTSCDARDFFYADSGRDRNFADFIFRTELLGHELQRPERVKELRRIGKKDRN